MGAALYKRLTFLVIFMYGWSIVFSQSVLDTKTWKPYSTQECFNFHLPSILDAKEKYQDFELYIHSTFLPTGKIDWYVTMDRKKVDTGNPQADFQGFILDLKTQLFETIGDINFGEFRPIDLDHYTAYSWDFEGYLDLEKFQKVRQYFFYQGGYVFILSYIGNPDVFDENLGMIDQVIKTIYVDSNFRDHLIEVD